MITLQNIKLWVTQLSTATKIIWVFVPVLLGIAKLVTIHDVNIIAKSNAKQEQLIDKEDMKKAIVSIDTLSRILRKHVRDQVIMTRQMDEKLTDVINTTEVVKKQLGNHIIKTATDKQDIINWMDAFEKKNNSILIPFGMNSLTRLK